MAYGERDGAWVLHASRAEPGPKRKGEPARDDTSGELIAPKILIVDDHETSRLAIQEHLRAAGFRTVLAPSGELGIRAFTEESPDLVVLDVVMPGLSGYAVCSYIKSHSRGRDIPVVFLTALGNAGLYQRALEVGADDFLSKPVSRTELFIRVRSLLRMVELRKELLHGYELIRSQRDELLLVQRQRERLSQLMVHDLKNPLSSILSNGHFVEAHPSLTTECREAMRDLLSSASSMHRMLLNLLDISRGEGGKLVLNETVFALDELVEEVCSAFRRRVEERGARLEREVQVAALRADRDLVRRVLENLLDNAIKYSASAGLVRVRAFVSEESEVELCVEDRGPGIPEEHRESIFHLYFQVGQGARDSSSRGIGLAFCRLAASAHGARIWVEAGEPQGSAFRLRFPVTSTVDSRA